ncbi:MAG TPA: hypothetical protein VE953_18270 [Terriglobales bacterium]|nr:hypothetical protein [Terriglobales bacterium]
MSDQPSQVGQAAAPTPLASTSTAATGSELRQRFTTAVADLRGLAKWLLAVFAAIAGVLTAGTQLSGVGHLQFPSARLWLAVGCVLVALIAIAIILWLFVEVLTPGHISLTTLAAFEHDHPHSTLIKFVSSSDLLGRYEDVAALKKAYDDDNDRSTQQSIDSIIARILPACWYQETRTRFRRAFTIGLPCAVVAAVSVLGFTWAANPAGSSGPIQTPADADLTLTASSQALLADRLGSDCGSTSPVRVLVLSSSADSYDVVTVPTRECGAARFTVGGGPLGVDGKLQMRRTP